jgi:hypothetical protein
MFHNLSLTVSGFLFRPDSIRFIFLLPISRRIIQGSWWVRPVSSIAYSGDLIQKYISTVYCKFDDDLILS